MRAAGNQGDIEAPLEEAGPDGPADGTGTHDDEAHGVALCHAERARLSSWRP